MPLRECPHRAKRHRRKGWAIGGCACLGNAAPGGVGQIGKGRDVRAFALIGGHALGCVALHMLDRAEAFGGGLRDILGGDVIGEIEPCAPLARHMPERLALARLFIGHRRL